MPFLKDIPYGHIVNIPPQFIPDEIKSSKIFAEKVLLQGTVVPLDDAYYPADALPEIIASLKEGYILVNVQLHPDMACTVALDGKVEVQGWPS